MGTKQNSRSVLKQGGALTLHQHGKAYNSENIHYGEYVVVNHVERTSRLIGREDSTAQLHPPYARLGIQCRASLVDRTGLSTKAFFRPVNEYQPDSSSGVDNADDRCGPGGLDIWQIVPLMNTSKLSAISDRHPVLLRHLVTGFFLSLQPDTTASEDALSGAPESSSLKRFRAAYNFATPSPRTPETEYSVYLVANRDKSCEFFLETVDKNDVAAAQTAIAGAANGATSSPAIDIMADQNVVLKHVLTGCFLCAMDEALLAFRDYQIRRSEPALRALYRHGAWEEHQDIPVVCQSKYSISEAITVSRAPLERVKDVLVVQRMLPLLLAAAAVLQLSGPEHDAMAQYLPLMRTLAHRLHGFSSWLTCAEDDESSAEAPSAAVLVAAEETPDNRLSESLAITVHPDDPEYKTGPAVAMEKETDTVDDSQTERPPDMRQRLLGCLAALTGHNAAAGPKPAESKLPSEQQRQQMRRRQNLFANSRTLEVLLQLSHALFLLLRESERVSEARAARRASRHTKGPSSFIASPPPGSVTEEKEDVKALSGGNLLSAHRYPGLPKIKEVEEKKDEEEKETDNFASIGADLEKNEGEEDDEEEEEEEEEENGEMFYSEAVVAVLQDSAAAMMKVITDALEGNMPLRMRLLSGSDIISEWIQMRVFGWRPPIAQVLGASEYFSSKMMSAGLAQHTIVDPAELFLLVHRMIDLQRAGRSERAGDVLDLVTCLFTASEYFGTRALDPIMYSILQVFSYEEVLLRHAYMFPNVDHLRAIASSSYTPDINSYWGAGLTSDETAINSLSDAKKCLWFRVTSSAEVVPECAQLHDYPTTLLSSDLGSDISDLVAFLELFVDLDTGLLPLERAVVMLEDLGLSGPLLYRELLAVTLRTLPELVQWWWERSQFFLPTALYSLHGTPLQDVMAALAVELNEKLHSSGSRSPHRAPMEDLASSYLEALLASRLAALDSVYLRESEVRGVEVEGYQDTAGRLFEDDETDGANEDEEGEDDENFRQLILRRRRERLELAEAEYPRECTRPTNSRGLTLRGTAGNFRLQDMHSFSDDEEDEASDENDNARDDGVEPSSARKFSIFENAGRKYSVFAVAAGELLSRTTMRRADNEPESAAVRSPLKRRRKEKGKSDVSGLEIVETAAPPPLTVTWEVVFSRVHFEGDIWLRQSLLNLNSICDPRNPFVQKLITMLMPPDLLLNLLNSRRVLQRYKTLIIDILSKGYLRREGVFPCLIMTSYGGRFYIGLDDYVGGIVTPVSDVFNDATSPFTLEHGARLRKALREYLHASLQGMSMSMHSNLHSMDYNTALLRLLKESLQRGFFSALPPSKRDQRPDESQEMKAARELMEKATTEFLHAKAAISDAVPFNKPPPPSRPVFDSPFDIQDLVIERLALMEPPRESDALAAAAAGPTFLRMIDAVVDVLSETAEITKLSRVEEFAKISGRSNSDVGPVSVADTTATDLKLTKALLVLFAATPSTLTGSAQVQQKVQALLYAQVNERALVSDSLKSAHLFPLTEIALKSRQLSGLGSFILHNIEYLCKRLHDSSDSLLKRHLLDEIRLIFAKIGEIFSTFTLISRVNSNSDEEAKIHGGSLTLLTSAALIDLDHFSRHSHYSIDEYVESYFLEDFAQDLMRHLLRWRDSWLNLNDYDKSVGGRIVEFLAACGHNSEKLSTTFFDKLKDFALRYWHDDYHVSLLLEQFVYHKCAFQQDELLLVLTDVLVAMNVQEPSVAEIDPETICSTSHRLLPLLVVLLDIITLEDTNDAAPALGADVAPDAALPSQQDILDQVLFVLTRLAETVEDRKSSDEVERDVEVQSPLFIFTFKAIWAFLNNLAITAAVREELRQRLRDYWTPSFLSVIVRRRQCSVNIKALVMKVYLSLHPFDDYHLIGRCILKKIDAKPAEEKEDEDTKTASLSLPDIPSVPVLMDYLNDCLFIVGKVTLYHFFMMFSPAEREVALAARRKEVEERVARTVKRFLRRRGLKSSSAFSFAFKETLHFFRSAELFLSFENKEFAKGSLPAVYSVASFCEFLQTYCDTSVGYNRHIHHTSANHLVWLAAFAAMMIEDHDGSFLSEVQLEQMEVARQKLKSATETFLSWRQQSRKYSEILVVRGGTFHMQYKPQSDRERKRREQRDVGVTHTDAKYLDDVDDAQSSLLYKEVSRLVRRLSRRLVFYEGSNKTQLASAMRRNELLLNAVDGLAIHNLFRYLGDAAAPDMSTYLILTVVNALFRDYDCKLTAGSGVVFSLGPLRALQNSLASLGAAEMVAAIINRLAPRPEESGMASTVAAGDMSGDIVSLSIQLASNLMYVNNRRVQSEFMRLAGYNIETKIYSKSGPSLLLFISSFMHRNLSNSLEIQIKPDQFENVARVFRFCSVFAQQFDEAQDFLRDQHRPESLNMITEVASVLDFLLRYFSLKMVARGTEPLVETNATFNWSRDYVKSSHPTMKPEAGSENIAQLLQLLGTGCSSLKDMCQGPCTPNQNSATPALRELPVLLDVIGTHLSAKHRLRYVLPGVNFAKSSLSSSAAYLATSTAATAYDALLADKVLSRSMRDLELSLVRFLLSLLEGVPQNRILLIGELLDEGILFDNLDRVYHRIFSGNKAGRTRAKNVAVAYLSLLLTVADAQQISQNISARTDNVKAWQARCEEEGHSTDSFLASVEIMDKNNNVDRVYFPIPDFVKQYWSYPEVQAAKGEVMWEVVRTSPEEKIADYFSQMNRLISVMNRQQLLASALSPPVHTLFGGKSPLPDSALAVIPSQRVFLLALTLIINAYFVYSSYTPDTSQDGSPGAGDFFGPDVWHRLVTSFDESFIVYLLRVLHFALTVSLVIRKVLNSRALDAVEVEVEDLGDGNSRFLKLLVFIGRNVLLSPATLCAVVLDSWWTISLCGLSYLGLFWGVGFYAGCILDSIPLIRYMSFLVTAVNANILKIALTLLLAYILLYQYAVITYFYFPDEYAFNGYFACSGDVLSCFKLHIDYGFNNAMEWTQHGDVGYINPSFSPFNYITDDGNYYRDLASKILGTVYNFVYYVLVNLVLQAIISGYIIDTFARMRDEQDTIEEDKRCMCFICSIRRDEFEQHGVNFLKHIKEEHNCWKYVWFRLHLARADPKLLSGPEYHSKPLFDSDKGFVKLVPIKQSMSLQQLDSHDED